MHLWPLRQVCVNVITPWRAGRFWSGGKTEIQHWLLSKTLRSLTLYSFFFVEYAVQAAIRGARVHMVVPHNLRKLNRIIANNIKSKYWIRTHKLGIKCWRLLLRHNNLMLRAVTPMVLGRCPQAKQQEMKKACPAFKVWEKLIDKIPPGHRSPQSTFCGMQPH